MLRVRARYADETTRAPGTPQPIWPPYCACCGVPTASTMELRHVARESAGGFWSPDGIVAYNVPSSGHFMTWPVPCCEACQKHSRKSRNPLRLKTALVVGGVVTMFIGGFALFSMGIADEPDASPMEIAIAVAFVVANFYAWYGIWRLVAAWMRARGSSLRTPICADSLKPVSASSGSEFVRFDFTNDNYARGFAQANGLLVEPVPSLFPIVGDMLAQIQP